MAKVGAEISTTRLVYQEIPVPEVRKRLAEAVEFSVKALLIVIVAWSDLGTSFVTPMPSMEGCEAAAVKVYGELRARYRKEGFTVLCVENR